MQAVGLGLNSGRLLVLRLFDIFEGVIVRKLSGCQACQGCQQEEETASKLAPVYKNCLVLGSLRFFNLPGKILTVAHGGRKVTLGRSPKANIKA